MIGNRRTEGIPDNAKPFRRRLGDLLADYALAEAQLQVLQEGAGPHHLRNVQQRIVAVHRRLDRIENSLRKRAEQRGIDRTLPISELCSRLKVLI